MRAALAAVMIWAAILLLLAAVVLGGCARREAAYWGSVAAELGRRCALTSRQDTTCRNPSDGSGGRSRSP